MSAVIDASVIVKWFFAEVHSEEAVALIERTGLVLVPDLLWAELTTRPCCDCLIEKRDLREKSDKDGACRPGARSG